MKINIGPVSVLAKSIENDLLCRAQSKVDKRALYNLSECASCALITKSVNSYEWISVLPRESLKDSKEKHIKRVLSSPLIDVPKIMSLYIPEIVKNLSQNEKGVVLMMDQSQICDGIQVLMISLRFGNRAIPVLWEIEETKGAIGFGIQEKLLNDVKNFIPPEILCLKSTPKS